MNQAIQVAFCLIELASKEVESDYLTNLRLQKLLYYCQGWSLALYDRPLFKEPVEAWTHGPVVWSVYQHFKKCGSEPILPNDPAVKPCDLSEQDKGLVASIWEGYKHYSAGALRKMTHSERPWQFARRDVEPDSSCRIEISPIDMRDFFREEYRKTQIPGMELERVQGWYDPQRERQYTSLEEAKARFMQLHAPTL